MISSSIRKLAAGLAALALNAAPAQDDVQAQAALVERAKAAVAHDLKDPWSARFRDVHVHHDFEDWKTVCGQVNAKNSYGAYSGFQRFFYVEDHGEPTAAVEPGGPASSEWVDYDQLDFVYCELTREKGQRWLRNHPEAQ